MTGLLKWLFLVRFISFSVSPRHPVGLFPFAPPTPFRAAPKLQTLSPFSKVSHSPPPSRTKVPSRSPPKPGEVERSQCLPYRAWAGNWACSVAKADFFSFFFFWSQVRHLSQSHTFLSYIPVPSLHPRPLNQPRLTRSTPKARRVLRCREWTRLLNPLNSPTLG